LLFPAENPQCLGFDTCRAAIEENFKARLHHAHLWIGPRGVGKRTFAYALSRFVLNKGYWLENPSVPLFRQIASHTHPDFLCLSGEGVQEVRRLRTFLERHALDTSGWKVVLIPEVGEWNLASQNALLKNLEEPPPRTLFLLTAQFIQPLLPTIRSRVHKHFVRPYTHPSDFIQDIRRASSSFAQLSEEEGQDLYREARGCLGRALRIENESHLSDLKRLRGLFTRIFPHNKLGGEGREPILPLISEDYRFLERLDPLWVGDTFISWIEEQLVQSLEKGGEALTNRRPLHQRDVRFKWLMERRREIQNLTHEASIFHLSPTSLYASYFAPPT
jgi:DNA polymerase III delta prime subunit